VHVNAPNGGFIAFLRDCVDVAPVPAFGYVSDVTYGQRLYKPTLTADSVVGRVYVAAS
jgi:hypothetical protein